MADEDTALQLAAVSIRTSLPCTAGCQDNSHDSADMLGSSVAMTRILCMHFIDALA